MAIRPDRPVFKPAERKPLNLAIGRSRLAGRAVVAAPIPTVTPITTDVATVATRTLLDKVHARLRRSPDDAGPAMYDLHAGLSAIRSHSDPQAWEQAIAQCVAHPLAALAWQDPFTAHGYRKPRGYAGDAQLIDYLYGLAQVPPGTTPEGASVFQHLMGLGAALSVRSRGEILARLIDETAARFDAPRILSIACGHLREGFRSSALNAGRIGEFVALDQDDASLAEVDRAFAAKGVRTTHHSVREILAGKVRFEGFHFVYAAGLYDYLSDRVATRLTKLMFDMLAPEGRVLIANFAPRLPEVAYMEAFMDWKLIYRTPDEMAALADDISADAWESNRLFWDAHGNIVFLDLVKRSARAPEDLAFGSVAQLGAGSPATPGSRNLSVAAAARSGAHGLAKAPAPA